MPLPTVIADLNTTASLNYPAGTDSPAVLDDVQRAHASFIAQLRDANTGTNTGDNATNTQYSGLAASKANAGPLASSGITGAAAAGANTDITSLSGLTAALSIAQGGTASTTAAAARTALGAAAAGANTDITSLGGITTALSIAQGGSGSATAFAASYAASGYQKLPGGLIIQWGSQVVTSTQTSYNFPIAFPTAGLAIVLADGDAGGSGQTFGANIASATQFSAISSGASVLASYIAIG